MDRGINSIQAVFDGKQWHIIQIVWQAEPPPARSRKSTFHKLIKRRAVLEFQKPMNQTPPDAPLGRPQRAASLFLRLGREHLSGQQQSPNGMI
jgi:hypothetical protein